jgi:hypothetical protein
MGRNERLTHLLFVHDVLIFYFCVESEGRTLKDILDIFCDANGMVTNVNKSSIYFLEVEEGIFLLELFGLDLSKEETHHQCLERSIHAHRYKMGRMLYQVVEAVFLCWRILSYGSRSSGFVLLIELEMFLVQIYGIKGGSLLQIYRLMGGGIIIGLTIHQNCTNPMYAYQISEIN